MAHKITLVQACDGLLRTKTAAGLSPHTIADYKNTFKKLFLFFDGETPLQDVSRKDIVDFFAWLQEEYISNPDGVAPRRNKPLSPKSIRNIHTNLSAFWAWAGNPYWSRMGDKQFLFQKRMVFTYHADIIEEITLIRTKDQEISGSNPVIKGLDNYAELIGPPVIRIYPP